MDCNNALWGTLEAQTAPLQQTDTSPWLSAFQSLCRCRPGSVTGSRCLSACGMAGCLPALRQGRYLVSKLVGLSDQLAFLLCGCCKLGQAMVLQALRPLA